MLDENSSPLTWSRAYNYAQKIRPVGGCLAIADDGVDPRIARLIRDRAHAELEINIKIVCAYCVHVQYCAKRAGD